MISKPQVYSRATHTKTHKTDPGATRCPFTGRVHVHVKYMQGRDQHLRNHYSVTLHCFTITVKGTNFKFKRQNINL